MKDNLNPKLKRPIALIKATLENAGYNSVGSAFGKDTFDFDAFGTVSTPFYSDSISVCYDLGVSEDLKAKIAIALQDIDGVTYSTGDRYKDMYGNWHVDEPANVLFAYEFLIQNTDFEDQVRLMQLLQLNISDLNEGGTRETTH